LILDVLEDVWERDEEKGEFGGYRYINNTDQYLHIAKAEEENREETEEDDDEIE